MSIKKVSTIITVITLLVFVVTLVGCGDTAKPPVEQKKAESKVEDKVEKSIDLDRDAIGENGVVSAAKPEASEVGVEILKKGGNAIDAAVATAFAIGVVEPNASGLGGGGFMLIRHADTGEEVFLDFREVAPKNATPDMYELDEDGRPINEASTLGGKSVAVPGQVAGLLTALEKYGTMTREEVLQPAIDLAENGFVVSKNFSRITGENIDRINSFEATKEIYLKSGLPYEEGDIFTNKDLANTLKKIAKEGKDAFYKGEIAKAIVDEVQRTGGIITLEDLENYEVKVREPVKGTYRGYEIVSVPPSSSGGTHLVQLLNILENFNLKDLGHNTTDSIHVWSEAIKLMFADRDKYMADTDFVDVPLTGLISKDYAKELYKKIDMNKSAQDVKADNPYKYESGSTTHFSVMDKEGNMVAVTQTINYYFGSGVTVPGTGILLNNEMDDFEVKPGCSNSIEPGKRPLSSMTPTLVIKNGKPFMTLGSPGATRIITTVAQVISNIIDYDMDIQEAINVPRIYDRRGELQLEGRFDKKIVEELEARGHYIEVSDKDYDGDFGAVQGVMFDKSGKLHGGADPRLDGKAAAY